METHVDTSEHRAKEFVEHLGNIIHISHQSVKKVIRIFNTKVNALIKNFWFAPIDVKCHLFIGFVQVVCPCMGHSSGIMTVWNVSDVYSMVQGSSPVVAFIPARIHCNLISPILGCNNVEYLTSDVLYEISSLCNS